MLGDVMAHSTGQQWPSECALWRDYVARGQPGKPEQPHPTPSNESARKCGGNNVRPMYGKKEGCGSQITVPLPTVSDIDPSGERSETILTLGPQVPLALVKVAPNWMPLDWVLVMALL